MQPVKTGCGKTLQGQQEVSGHDFVVPQVLQN
jgi:hypothetical protein